MREEQGGGTEKHFSMFSFPLFASSSLDFLPLPSGFPPLTIEELPKFRAPIESERSSVYTSRSRWWTAKIKAVDFASFRALLLFGPVVVSLSIGASVFNRNFSVQNTKPRR